MQQPRRYKWQSKIRFQCRTQHYMWCNYGEERIAYAFSFQCRTQHFMWCNFYEKLKGVTRTWFQCRTQHFMWCNKNSESHNQQSFGFNAARSILCGATEKEEIGRVTYLVSMPHAAFYVVQLNDCIPSSITRTFQCRTQHFMWCNCRRVLAKSRSALFQCRTQHFMWCNIERGVFNGKHHVSMPHAAFYVVQLHLVELDGLQLMSFNAARSILCGATPIKICSLGKPTRFQCRTQRFVGCNL